MAKQIANVDILVDTYNTWILRTNELIGALGSEVLTANSTLAITGSEVSPKNARLYGNLQVSTSIANNAIFDSIQANNSHIVIKPNTLLVADGTVGDAGGRYLTSDGTKVYWSVAPGQGTVTSVANGAGLLGGTITTAGTLRVKAGAGIDVDTRGVSVNTQFLAFYATNAQTLQNKTWDAPAKIGSGVANTGDFTTVTATTYKATGDDSFILNKDTIRLAGVVDAMTPGDGTGTGGVRIRARDGGKASLQFTNQIGTIQYGAATVDSAGKLTWSGSQSIAGNLHISTSNGTGGGLILSDDGDIVDLNDGYASFRFSTGVAIYSENKGGSRTITLGNDGTIIGAGQVYSNSNQRLVSINEFTNGSGVGIGTTYGSTGNWVRLPNGMLLQWGTIPSKQDSSTTLYFPQAFATSSVAVTCSGGVKVGNNSAGENPTTVYEVGSTYFKTWTTENVDTTAWWVAMGF